MIQLTTSDTKLEGPAIIMSEAGARMFFNFCLNIAKGNAGDVSPVAVDEFLRQYDEAKAGSDPEPPAGKRKRRSRVEGPKDIPAVYRKQYEALKPIMAGKEKMPLNEIYKAMQDAGMWADTTSKGAASKMVTLIRRFPEIEPLGGGMYRLNNIEGENNNGKVDA